MTIPTWVLVMLVAPPAVVGIAIVGFAFVLHTLTDTSWEETQ